MEEMKNAREQIIEILKQLPEEDWLQCMMMSTQKVAKQLQISADKITNGSSTEHIACKKLGFVWCDKDVHGFDALDKKGRPCEIKTFKTTKALDKIANVNYAPKAKNKNEIEEQYITRYVKELSKITGGHYWVALNARGTKYIRHWHIRCESFALAMSDKLQKRLNKGETIDKKFNFGCRGCKKCKEYHRFDEICDTIDETHLFPDKVKCPCK